MSRKIYNCILFNNELDLLEIRLHELKNSVDIFVIVESNFDFKGFRKPLHFLSNAARFQEFHDRIRHVQASFPPHRIPFPHGGEEDPKCWENETYQRNIAFKAIHDAEEEDLIICNDADEIPCGAWIDRLKHTYSGPVRLVVREYIFNFNWTRGFQVHDGWSAAPIVISKRDLGEKTGQELHASVFPRLTDERGWPTGWHCTWFGGKEYVLAKEKWYSHQLASTFDQRLHSGTLYGYVPHQGWCNDRTEDLGLLPAQVQSNPIQYVHLFDEIFIQKHPHLFDERLPRL